MEDGRQGWVEVIEGGVHGVQRSKTAFGTVDYLRDTYAHVLAVQVTRKDDVVVIPWRNVASVVTVTGG